MRLLDRIRYGARAVFRRRRADRELDEDVTSWVDELTERHRAAGVDAAEARRRALADLGGADAVKQRVRDQRAGGSVTGLSQDVKYAARAVLRARAFTTSVILTFALGVGANTAIFSVVNAILIKPLPYRDSSRLVFIWSDMTDAGYPRAPLSGPELVDLRTRSTLFSGFGAIWSTSTTLSGNGDPEQLRIGLVTSNFFDVLGAAPALGRAFNGDDDGQTPNARILLSWALFKRRFGGDPAIVGRTILANGNAATVIGVMPETFRLLMPVDAAVPDDLQAWQCLKAGGLARAPRGQQYLRVVGRMKPGVTVAQARQDVTRVAGDVSHAFAEYGAAGRVFTTVGLQADGVREVRPALLALFGGVTLLLLIAAVNVAGLLVARAAARSRETALRIALGASTGRLVRECLVEGLVLSSLGGAAGLVVGWSALQALLAWRPATLDRLAAAHIDLRVLATTGAVALGWGVLLSLAPLTEMLRARLTTALHRDGQRVAGAANSRLRAGLVVVQIALGAVLLVGAGLLVRTFVARQRVDPGFHAVGTLSFRIAFPFARYPSRDKQDAAARQLQQGLAALPGVTGVGAISHLPYDDLPNWGGPYLARPGADPSSAVDADYRSVTPGFFETVGARMIEGRTFTEADDKTGQPVAIVDDVLARRAWPGETAVGQQIVVDPGSSGHPQATFTVVGVVHHLRVRSLVEDLAEQVYFPVRQVPRSPMAYVVRTASDPAGLAAPIRQTVAQLDTQLAVADVKLLQTYVDNASAGSRFTMVLAAAFAAVAVMLACVGVYGVVAYSVTRRRTEFGIRLALGARRWQIVGAVLRGGAWLAGAGLTIGAAGAAVAAHFLKGQLFGVTPTDLASYAIAIGVLGAAAMLACGVPALCSTPANPRDALTYE